MFLPAFNPLNAASTAIKNLLMAAAGTTLITLGIGETTQAATIDTTSSWNGVNYIWPFGEFNTGTYGQTFTVPETDNVITSFTFFLDEYDGLDVVDFAAYLAKWDGTKATGSILYESKAQSIDNVPGFQEFTFNTGEISLNPGEQYVAFLSASNFFDGEEGTGKLGYIAGIDDIYSGAGDVYSGGSFVFLNNGSDFSLLTTTPWETFVGLGLGDTAFKVTFQSPTPVPEPLSLGGVTVAGLLGMWLTKKQAARKNHQCT
ncbi:hypothetical protein I8748_25680 [Nostoc sp. CENA67]|uniref:PEP-CTERM sorting domain-containing protein n=1 Tax=Amazonocrinis nigriterrae CENA67 TaxID=2794033 RepID=A0A8J7LB93_9NOST|nr:hypothetical protein [Amazonocrinis nigriterrae]MBH8565525.1 hypothetical protein [Amazonocrinis nigriterrae CENA67]